MRIDTLEDDNLSIDRTKEARITILSFGSGDAPDIAQGSIKGDRKVLRLADISVRA